MRGEYKEYEIRGENIYGTEHVRAKTTKDALKAVGIRGAVRSTVDDLWTAEVVCVGTGQAYYYKDDR